MKFLERPSWSNEGERLKLKALYLGLPATANVTSHRQRHQPPVTLTSHCRHSPVKMERTNGLQTSDKLLLSMKDLICEFRHIKPSLIKIRWKVFNIDVAAIGR